MSVPIRRRSRVITRVRNPVERCAQLVEPDVQERLAISSIHIREDLSTPPDTISHQVFAGDDHYQPRLSTEFTAPTTTTTRDNYQDSIRIRVPDVCGYATIWDSVGPLRSRAQTPVEVR